MPGTKLGARREAPKALSGAFGHARAQLCWALAHKENNSYFLWPRGQLGLEKGHSLNVAMAFIYAALTVKQLKNQKRYLCKSPTFHKPFKNTLYDLLARKTVVTVFFWMRWFEIYGIAKFV